mgnify:CR=1 FL=1
MKPLVEFIARGLVDEPDEVQVQQREAGRTVVVSLTCAQGDTGKVIGKEGRVAKAMRSLLATAAMRRRRRAILADACIPPAAVALGEIRAQLHDKVPFSIVFFLQPGALPMQTAEGDRSEMPFFPPIGSVACFVEREKHRRQFLIIPVADKHTAIDGIIGNGSRDRRNRHDMRRSRPAASRHQQQDSNQRTPLESD